MARKQVIVQLDDRLVRSLDEAAARAGINRSELLRRAARAYLREADREEADRETVEAYRTQPEDAAEWEAWTRVGIENWPKW